jgi:tetratricopeptide (TPR) repeat protein
MPKPIKKRVQKKKALIKEEEIKTTFAKILEFIKNRQKQFLIGLSSVLVVIIILLIALFYNSSLREKAYAFEVEAYNYYYGINLKEELSAQQRWQKALELYKKSVDTKVTPTTLFYLGNCYYNLSKYNEAISEYERLIKRFPREVELLPIVYQKLASAYMNTGNKEMAINTLNRLAGLDNGIFKDTALILEARYHEQTGQKEKAIEKYKELVDNFQDSPWFGEADAKVKIAEQRAKDKQEKETTQKKDAQKTAE